MSAPLPSNPQDRVLVYAVHPDDETLGAGGLIQKALAAGAALRVVIVTDGDNNPWPQRYVERSWRLSPDHRQRWGKQRRAEALAALAILGVDAADVLFMGLPDQGLTELLKNSEELVQQLADEIAGWQPSCIVAPALQDEHPDHNAFGLMLELALARLAPEQPHPQVMYYLIHGERIYAPACSLELSEAEVTQKREATLCHASQMVLSRRRFLHYVTRRESFQPAPTFDAYQLQHPVRAVTVAAPLLTLDLLLPGWVRRMGQPVLSVMTPQALYRIDLAARGTIAVQDGATRNAVCQAYLVTSDDGLQLSMPLSLFAGVEHLYFKVERRWAFFDPAGWRGASLAPQRTTSPVVALMPCYDVEDFCEKAILQTLHYVDQLIVIDDGSSDNTAHILRRLAVQLPKQISLIRFERNQGKGVGLMAGFVHALSRFDFEVLVTLDADGQHPPARIPQLVDQIRAGAEMAIGERQVNEMPGRSRVGNTLATGAIRCLHPHAPSDTQSGMRAFNRDLIEEIARRLSGSRYETEFQILLLALSQGRRIATTPIPTIYIDNNRSSKFRPVLDTLRIARTMIHWR